MHYVVRVLLMIWEASLVANDPPGFLVVTWFLPWRLSVFSEGNPTRRGVGSSKPKGFGRQEISGILTVL